MCSALAAVILLAFAADMADIAEAQLATCVDSVRRAHVRVRAHTHTHTHTLQLNVKIEPGCQCAHDVHLVQAVSFETYDCFRRGYV